MYDLLYEATLEIINGLMVSEELQYILIIIQEHLQIQYLTLI
jgi:hypothetical protein